MHLLQSAQYFFMAFMRILTLSWPVIYGLTGVNIVNRQVLGWIQHWDVWNIVVRPAIRKKCRTGIFMVGELTCGTIRRCFGLI